MPEIAGGAAGELEALRDASRAAVDWVFTTASRVAVLVSGTAPEHLSPWSLTGFGIDVGDGPPLPLAAGIAAWLLGGRPATCLSATGRQPLSGFDGVLVMGDGSACRTDKAPGHDDPRAVPFDAAVLDALAVGDPRALAGIDLAVAEELLVSGAPVWAHLAASVSTVPYAHLDVAEDPYGVLYAVARWIARWEDPA